MGFLGKFGRKLRGFGEKLTAGIRTVGSKVGGVLLGASPVLATIPGLGAPAAALSASVGGAALGVAGLAGAAHDAIAGRGVDVGAIKQGYTDVKGSAKAVRDTYGGLRNRSSLER
eukprot:jgi/Tetstr1/440542/TSEL_028865.t1